MSAILILGAVHKASLLDPLPVPYAILYRKRFKCRPPPPKERTYFMDSTLESFSRDRARASTYLAITE